ncbi:MAG TPA: hypothetical protein VM686_19445, partial [Polyangiaceae bacterium]|nr:hypothetical protein [Polyangiaceae bacterium]
GMQMVITDGTNIYLGGDIHKMPVTGGTPRLLAKGGTNNARVGYAIDDQYLYWIVGGLIRRVPK